MLPMRLIWLIKFKLWICLIRPRKWVLCTWSDWYSSNFESPWYLLENASYAPDLTYIVQILTLLETSLEMLLTHLIWIIYFKLRSSLTSPWKCFLRASSDWYSSNSEPPRYLIWKCFLIPSLTFTDYEWFPWSICIGFGMPAGSAYPSGHLVPFRFWDLLMLQLLKPISSNLPCLYSTFHLEYPLVLSRFCFLRAWSVA